MLPRQYASTARCLGNTPRQLAHKMAKVKGDAGVEVAFTQLNEAVGAHSLQLNHCWASLNKHQRSLL